MEQSLAGQAGSQFLGVASTLTSPPTAFSLPVSTQQPSIPATIASLRARAARAALPGLAGLTYPTATSSAGLGSVTGIRFPTNPSSLDPPASGPRLAMAPTTTATASLRTIPATIGVAAASSRPRRRVASRASRRPNPPMELAGISAASLAAPPATVPPRRSTRRKRAPASASASTTRDDPPAKKRRGNLKAPPPGSVSDDGEVKTASCCICMDEPKPADLASISGCDHLFCFDCIEKWAERENTCPLCKERFTKIDRVNKTRKKSGGGTKNTKRVKQKDQRSDIAPGAALEGLLASFASSANFPPHRVARLIFSGMGGNPFLLPGASALRNARAGRTAGATAAERANTLEDSLFSSDTDDDEDNSFLPTGPGGSFADLFRAVPLASRGGAGLVVGGLGAPRSGISFASYDPPSGRSYASNGGDRNAGSQAENPLEIEDDSEEEGDVEVVQVTRPV